MTLDYSHGGILKEISRSPHMSLSEIAELIREKQETANEEGFVAARGEAADTITALHSRVAYLERANGLARLGLQAVCNLINESDGVYGLHLNGDGTPWETLMADGEFDWLADFEAATNVLLTGEKADG
jgi:hypothetical protein